MTGCLALSAMLSINRIASMQPRKSSSLSKNSSILSPCLTMDNCSGTMSEQLDSSAADLAQQQQGAAPAPYENHEEAPSTSYVHRHGTREYMQAEVMPYVQQALEALAVKIQQERLKLAAGVNREDGKYLPHGWRPFCPHRWMAEYLLAHKPATAQLCLQAAGDGS